MQDENSNSKHKADFNARHFHLVSCFVAKIGINFLAFNFLEEQVIMLRWSSALCWNNSSQNQQTHSVSGTYSLCYHDMYRYYRQQNSTLPKLEPSTELNFLITPPLDFFYLSLTQVFKRFQLKKKKPFKHESNTQDDFANSSFR